MPGFAELRWWIVAMLLTTALPFVCRALAWPLRRRQRRVAVARAMAFGVAWAAGWAIGRWAS